MKKKLSIKGIHFVLIFLFIAILIVLKFSSLPTPRFLPDKIAIFFEKPNSNTTSYELLRLLENLSLAYIAAFIFYLLIDFFPKQNASKKAFLILRPKFVGIYLDMSQIISHLKMILELKKKNTLISIEDVAPISFYKPEFEKIYYRSTTYLSDKGESGTTKGIFLFHKDFANIASRIILKVGDVTKLPITFNADADLVEILSSIESCEFLERCKNLTQGPLLQSKEHTKANFGNKFYDFIQLYVRFSKYNFRKISYNYVRLFEKEIHEMQEEQRKVYLDGQLNITTKFYNKSIEFRIENGKLVQ